MIFLFHLHIPHYEKYIEAVELVIYWIKGAARARELKELCENDYISYKKEVADVLGLKDEYDTKRGKMFHSYEMYQTGQTLFLYDKMSCNPA